ncbi:hypothetical protein C4D60_Mb10t11340 [Musa balbisiana]|uniref:Uncharacterized protein n=1 Tax=Musa balbisiana TaxID=52838 RepID=A0A4S8IWA9_MUSBA|nr:hypothetical protein C4D60_Mb10t11340 [Musa balbisiana]
MERFNLFHQSLDSKASVNIARVQCSTSSTCDGGGGSAMSSIANNSMLSPSQTPLDPKQTNTR